MHFGSTGTVLACVLLLKKFLLFFVLFFSLYPTFSHLLTYLLSLYYFASSTPILYCSAYTLPYYFYYFFYNLPSSPVLHRPRLDIVDRLTNDTAKPALYLSFIYQRISISPKLSLRNDTRFTVISNRIFFFFFHIYKNSRNFFTKKIK